MPVCTHNTKDTLAAASLQQGRIRTETYNAVGRTLQKEGRYPSYRYMWERKNAANLNAERNSVMAQRRIRRLLS